MKLHECNRKNLLLALLISSTAFLTACCGPVGRDGICPNHDSKQLDSDRLAWTVAYYVASNNWNQTLFAWRRNMGASMRQSGLPGQRDEDWIGPPNFEIQDSCVLILPEGVTPRLVAPNAPASAMEAAMPRIFHSRSEVEEALRTDNRLLALVEKYGCVNVVESQNWSGPYEIQLSYIPISWYDLGDGRKLILNYNAIRTYTFAISGGSNEHYGYRLMFVSSAAA